jgi:hypothetical protein
VGRLCLGVCWLIQQQFDDRVHFFAIHAENLRQPPQRIHFGVSLVRTCAWKRQHVSSLPLQTETHFREEQCLFPAPTLMQARFAAAVSAPEI